MTGSSRGKSQHQRAGDSGNPVRDASNLAPEPSGRTGLARLGGRPSPGVATSTPDRCGTVTSRTSGRFLRGPLHPPRMRRGSGSTSSANRGGTAGGMYSRPWPGTESVLFRGVFVSGESAVRRPNPFGSTPLRSSPRLTLVRWWRICHTLTPTGEGLWDGTAQRPHEDRAFTGPSPQPAQG